LCLALIPPVAGQPRELCLLLLRQDVAGNLFRRVSGIPVVWPCRLRCLSASDAALRMICWLDLLVPGRPSTQLPGQKPGLPGNSVACPSEAGQAPIGAGAAARIWFVVVEFSTSCLICSVAVGRHAAWPVAQNAWLGFDGGPCAYLLDLLVLRVRQTSTPGQETRASNSASCPSEGGQAPSVLAQLREFGSFARRSVHSC